MDEFTKAYIECILWAENDNSDPETGGDPLDKNYDADDFDRETLDKIKTDCETFQEKGKDALEAVERMEAEGEWSLPGGVTCSVREYAGHDFWLTRQGHGCGFWDGDWPEPYATLLNDLAESFDEQWVDVDDDGNIYII